jgi:hypothetical protein
MVSAVDSSPHAKTSTFAPLHRTATGMDGYKMDGKSLVVRIAGQKDNRGPRGSYGGRDGHGDGHGNDRVGALRGPHGTMHAGGGPPQPPPPGTCKAVLALFDGCVSVCGTRWCVGI